MVPPFPVICVGQIANLFAMCAGRTGGRMKIALPHVLRFSTGCGRLSRVLFLRGCRAWIRMKMGLILWQPRLSYALDMARP